MCVVPRAPLLVKVSASTVLRPIPSPAFFNDIFSKAGGACGAIANALPVTVQATYAAQNGMFSDEAQQRICCALVDVHLSTPTAAFRSVKSAEPDSSTMDLDGITIHSCLNMTTDVGNSAS